MVSGNVDRCLHRRSQGHSSVNILGSESLEKEAELPADVCPMFTLCLPYVDIIRLKTRFFPSLGNIERTQRQQYKASDLNVRR